VITRIKRTASAFGEVKRVRGEVKKLSSGSL